MIETRISIIRFAEMSEDTDAELKAICKQFGDHMRFDFDFEYYTIYFEPENWLQANLAMPHIDRLLTRVVPDRSKHGQT